jgi:hypothetical protein
LQFLETVRVVSEVHFLHSNIFIIFQIPAIDTPPKTNRILQKVANFLKSREAIYSQDSLVQ